MVCAHHARPQPAQSPCHQISNSEQYLVDRDCGNRRYSHGHLSLCRPRRYGSVDEVISEEYPNFNTVGETWVTEPAYTAAWQKDSRLTDRNSYLPTVMDFSFYDKINQAKNEETDDWWK